MAAEQCLNSRANQYAKDYRRTLQGKYTELKASAKKRKIECSLSLEDYTWLTLKGLCEYCESELPAAGHGLDRIDSSAGYTVENVVPCCTDCNLIRGDKMTHTEFKVVAKTLKAIREKKLSYKEKEERMIEALKEYNKSQESK